jgi:hypothetical protein
MTVCSGAMTSLKKYRAGRVVNCISSKHFSFIHFVSNELTTTGLGDTVSYRVYSERDSQ